VSSSKVETVTNYIIRQKIYHQVHTFKDEMEQFIKEYDLIEYNEKYFWD
jgi:hypothetical protein